MICPTFACVSSVGSLVPRRSVVLALMSLCAFAFVAACSPTPSFSINWSAQDDISAFREEFAGSAAMAHRIGEIEDAAASETYSQFREQVENSSPASKAMIYYEAASSVSHYYFVLAVEDDEGCRLYVSENAGARELTCSAIQQVSVAPEDDTRVILDPGVAVLVQFDGHGTVFSRSLRLLDDTASPADADALFTRIDRIFAH